MKEGIKNIIQKLMDLDTNYEVLNFRLEFNNKNNNINITATLVEYK